MATRGSPYVGTLTRLLCAVPPGMLDDSGWNSWSVPRLPRQVRVVLLLVAGIITATGWLVFAIAWEITWNDELAGGGLVACLFGIAIVGMLSIASRAEREPHRPRGGATQRSFFTTPRAVLVVVWLSIVGAGSWARSSSLGLLDLSDRSGWSLMCSFAADLLTVAWGGFLGQHRAWGWVAGSAVAAATVASVASTLASARAGLAGDGPFLGLAFGVDLVVLGIALLVGVSCMAVVRSVASVGGGH